MNSTNILLVDNDAEFLETRSERLSELGYITALASSIEEARSKANSGQFDLAIIDIRLTDDADDLDSSGIALAKSINLPVIMLTSYADHKLTRKAFVGTENVFDVVSKQEGLGSLIDAIERALTQTRLVQKSITTNAPLKQSRVRLNVDGQLEADYDEVRKQGKLIFYVTLASAITFGLVFISGVVLLLIFKASEGTVITLASLLPAALSGLFGKIYSDANKRKDAYHKELLTLWQKSRRGPPTPEGK